MIRASVCSVILIASSALAQPAPGPTRRVSLAGHNFTLPAGMEIELIAGPGLVPRPIVADLDEQGRLYVADSAGVNQRGPEQLVNRPHRILRLEDTDGDGKYDRSTVFADRMMFPEGAMWFAGSLYIAAPPQIWKLTDTDNDGVADKREVWFDGKTLTGCANDLHGPYLGRDGRIYWAKGAWAEQTHPHPGRKTLVTKAAHIFRADASGSRIEPVMTGGMDNPVDVTFTSTGERIFTTTFFQHPGGGKRDGLVHAIYGGIYGKEHAPIFDHPWTGPNLMPVLTHMGPAAPCGLTVADTDALGSRGNLFACQFNLRKVSRHILEADGSALKSRDEDFLVSDNFDFHPTDVLEDADGSLIVVDTGGWYKICCPTSQLHKPDILGGIYRIRRSGSPTVADPRGLALDWSKPTPAQLADRLSDARPAVRRRSTEALAALGEPTIAPLRKVIESSTSAQARLDAVWTLCRIELGGAGAALIQALSDADASVVHAALHALALRREATAVEPLLAVLRSPSHTHRRIAAEVLGRIGDKAAVAGLLTACAQATDRSLEHALTYAVIEIGDVASVVPFASHADPRVRRAALVALDQMPGSNLTATAVAEHLTAPDAALRESAAWIVGRHPEWGAQLAERFRALLSAPPTGEADRAELVKQLARLAKTPAVQQVLADRLRGTDAEPTRLALRAIAGAGLRETPPAWLEGLRAAVETAEPTLALEAIGAVRSLPVSKVPPRELTAALAKRADAKESPEPLRLAAAAAVPGGLPEVSSELFALLSKRLDADGPVAVRSLAAEALAKAKLSPAQMVELAAALRTCSPMELARLMDAFAKVTDADTGAAAVTALAGRPANSGLRPDAVRTTFAKYPTSVKEPAEKLAGSLNADEAKQRARLELLLTTLKNGDIRRGQAVFNSAKAACSACHAIGYVGGNVGPDLTRIGGIRQERDLLESIVFPSAALVRSFEPVLIQLKDERLINGLVRRETPEEIVLATGPNQETRVAKDDIAEIRPGTLSIMPAGLEQQLSPQDLADLVAFLKACK